MIRQDDKRFLFSPRGRNIHDYGCGIMCCFFLGNKLNKNLSLDVNQILFKIEEYIKNKWLEEDMTVLEWEKIVKDLTEKEVKYLGHIASDVKCQSNQREILQWFNKRTNFKHFTCGDGEGHCTYDPLGESVSVREGYVFSKRIFSFKEI
jgi:hypothetical protein